MPESARTRLPDIGRAMAEVREAARSLQQQSRFLCRQSDRLRSHSNDLLTVAMFQRHRAPADSRRAQLRLVP